MTKRTLLSFLLCLGLCTTAFGKGTPNSKWQNLLKQVNVHGQAIRSGHSHAKTSVKNPYVITTVNWSNGASNYTDSAEKVLLAWNPDSSLEKVIIYDYSNPATMLVIDSFRQMAGGAEFNEFDFLGDMLPVKAKAYEKSGGNWVLMEQYSFTYTSRGLEQMLAEIWNGTAWENDEMEYHLFDTHDMPLGYLYQKWISGDWTNIAGSRVDYYYTDDLPDSAIYSEIKFGASDWTAPENGTVKEVYTMNIYEEVASALVYRADGAKDSIVDITWHDYKAEQAGFLALGGTQYEEYTVHTWNSVLGRWLFKSHNTKTYNASDLETEEITQIFDENSSGWVNDWRVTHEYNTDGSVKEMLQYRWTNAQWIPADGRRYTNTYDTDGDLLTQIYDFYDGSAWVKLSKTIYSYTAPVGINSPVKIAAVNMYPNPASDNLIVVLNADGKNSTVNVFTLSGQLVSTAVSAQNKIVIDTQNLNPGTYILQVQSGSSLQTGRFVKH